MLMCRIVIIRAELYIYMYRGNASRITELRAQEACKRAHMYSYIYILQHTILLIYIAIKIYVRACASSSSASSSSRRRVCCLFFFLGYVMAYLSIVGHDSAVARVVSCHSEAAVAMADDCHE